MTTNPTPPGVGLILIGSELLDGRVRDRHAETCRSLLQARHINQPYTVILEDERELITSHLRWAMARPEPFFCCGGIGATPDDHTRQCAAVAADTGIERHAEAVDILNKRYGKDATPARLRMVEFPTGSRLIPNPVNQVPGFSIGNGHFLPGFPSMAAPMMEWVLDTYYAAGEATARRSLVLNGVREGDIVDLMHRFISGHPRQTFSSLPRFTEKGTEVVLSIHGPAQEVDESLCALVALLDEAGVPHESPEA